MTIFSRLLHCRLEIVEEFHQRVFVVRGKYPPGILFMKQLFYVCLVPITLVYFYMGDVDLIHLTAQVCCLWVCVEVGSV